MTKHDPPQREAQTPAASPSAKRASKSEPPPALNPPDEPLAGFGEGDADLPPNAPRNASRSAQQAAPAAAPGGVMPKGLAAGAQIDTPTRADFRPDPKVHLTQAGRVSLGNFVGKVGNQHVRVYRGAQEDKIPEPIRKFITDQGGEFGTISHADLGLRQQPASFVFGGPERK